MTVVVEGRYFGIANFLRPAPDEGPGRGRARCARKGRLYSVDQVQFAGSPDERLLQATMTLNAYRFGGAAAAAPAPAGTAATTSGSTSAAPATAP